MPKASQSLPQLPAGRNGTDVRLSGFIAACLQPLPDGEQQVDAPAWRKACAADAHVEWNHGMAQVRVADARHAYYGALDRASPREVQRSLEMMTNLLGAYRDHVVAICRQCALPAPSEVELKWKNRMIKRHGLDQPSRELDPLIRKLGTAAIATIVDDHKRFTVGVGVMA